MKKRKEKLFLFLLSTQLDLEAKEGKGKLVDLQKIFYAFWWRRMKCNSTRKILKRFITFSTSIFLLKFRNFLYSYIDFYFVFFFFFFFNALTSDSSHSCLSVWREFLDLFFFAKISLISQRFFFFFSRDLC